MKKKPKLLTTLMGGDKRRHHVAAYVTQEGDWNQHEPNTGFARMFIAMLILHILIIGGIIVSDSSGSAKPSPRAPAAQALLTKSQHEIAGTPPSALAPAAATMTDGAGHETYEVRSGDSLPMIVARFGVDKDELIALNQLDQDVAFSAGTVLKIPGNKINTPLQISAARPLPPAALAMPSSSMTTAPDGSAFASEPPASTSEPLSSSALVSLASASDRLAVLAPLPDVTPLANTEAYAAPTAADTLPQATSKPKADKTDAVSSPARDKPVVKKTAVTSSPPRPVPTPSEMAKRPITKADSPPKTATKTPASAKGAAPKAVAVSGSHTMAKGETLYRLSAQYGVSVQSLMKANSIKDPARLRDGTKLVIPAK